MKQKLRLAGMKHKSDQREQSRIANQQDASRFTVGPQILPRLFVQVGRGDAQAVHNGSFRSPDESSNSAPCEKGCSCRCSHDLLIQKPCQSSRSESGDIFVTMDGYYTEGTHNIISAATGEAQNTSTKPILSPQMGSPLFCFLRRRNSIRLCLVLTSVFGPAILVYLFRGNENKSAPNGTRIQNSLDANPRLHHSQILWRKHVVVGDGNRIFIPESFESRYNAEVAPLLEEHADEIWNRENYPELSCQSSEHLSIKFSMAKSSILRASISSKALCQMNRASERNCFQTKHITDIRDLTVRFPLKSSRSMFSVELAEDVKHLDSHGNEVARAMKPLGVISGLFAVELSNTSILAIQRNCGKNRDDFIREGNGVNMWGNTRIITMYELKRMYARWANGVLPKTSWVDESVWDANHLSNAAIDPMEHSLRVSKNPPRISPDASSEKTSVNASYFNMERQSPQKTKLPKRNRSEIAEDEVSTALRTAENSENARLNDVERLTLRSKTMYPQNSAFVESESISERLLPKSEKVAADALLRTLKPVESREDDPAKEFIRGKYATSFSTRTQGVSFENEAGKKRDAIRKTSTESSGAEVMRDHYHNMQRFDHQINTPLSPLSHSPKSLIARQLETSLPSFPVARKPFRFVTTPHKSDSARNVIFRYAQPHNVQTRSSVVRFPSNPLNAARARPPQMLAMRESVKQRPFPLFQNRRKDANYASHERAFISRPGLSFTKEKESQPQGSWEFL